MTKVELNELRKEIKSDLRWTVGTMLSIATLAMALITIASKYFN